MCAYGGGKEHEKLCCMRVSALGVGGVAEAGEDVLYEDNIYPCGCAAT